MFTFSRPPPDARYASTRPGPSWLAANQVARFTLVPLVLNLLPQAGFDVLHLHGDDWFMLRRRLATVRTFYGSALSEALTATSLRRQVSQSLVYPLEILSSHLATRSFNIGCELPMGYRADGSLMLAVREPVALSVDRTADPTILFVGTWGGRKRGAFLAERFAADVLPRHPDARLIMVSDRCEERPGITWIRFPSDDELSRLYGSSWIFCMPSTYEGFGMPYLEAMAHGLPVVATPNPGARMLLGNGAGALAADRDLGPMLAALLADPAASRRLPCAGSRALWNSHGSGSSTNTSVRTKGRSRLDSFVDRYRSDRSARPSPREDAGDVTCDGPQGSDLRSEEVPGRGASVGLG